MRANAATIRVAFRGGVRLTADVVARGVFTARCLRVAEIEQDVLKDFGARLRAPR